MTSSPTTDRTSAFDLAVFAEADAAALALARLVAQRASEAIAARGEFRIALAGGTTPRRVYEHLAATDLAATVAWSRVQVFVGDERCVPANDPSSNASMAREALLDRVPLPRANVHTIDGTLHPPRAAELYGEVLGDKPLDLVLLGLGDDGHTASLFPGGPELDLTGKRAVASTSPVPPVPRVSLSLESLNAAREVVFLATGPKKTRALRSALSQLEQQVDEGTYPAARVRPSAGRLQWFVDRAALGGDETSAAPALSDFGMIGLAVMGRNLALNIADRSFDVAVWNLEPELTARALAESEGRLRTTVTLPEFVASLERPRRIMLMIRAGAPVDAVLDALEPLLDPGDIVIDGGNSWFEDTRRREQRLARHGVHFVGMGVSGGEEGARNGPSLMPGGAVDAYERVRPVLEAIAARTEHGACVTHVGGDGAGHFVKMVHNGIEYADMQCIAEAYHVLSALLGQDPPQLAETFAAWNEGPLASFLVEITAQIFRRADPAGGWLVDQVLDRAGQKGTGKWTAEVALDLGIAVPSIAAAIDARVLSAAKADRVRMAPLLVGPEASEGAAHGVSVADVEAALFASKVGAYAQGMALVKAGAQHYGWTIGLGELARIWTGGCIIRARFLETMMRAWEQNPGLPNLLEDPTVREELAARQGAWRRVVAAAVNAGVPVPGMAASLAYYDAMRSARLPQNLVQAQRDAFGAHTYQRVDDPDGTAVHSDWLAG
jgi:6-phosphogluconate dehydrogenase